MAYQAVSSFRPMNIQSNAEYKMNQLQMQAEELRIKDAENQKQANILDSELQNELYDKTSAKIHYDFYDEEKGTWNKTSFAPSSLEFTKDAKKKLLTKYQLQFKKLGLPFNRGNFEEIYEKGRVAENRKLLTRLQIAKNRGQLNEDEFNAMLDNEDYRNYFLTIQDEKNMQMLNDMGYSFTGPEDLERSYIAAEKNLKRKMTNWKNMPQKFKIWVMNNPEMAAGLAFTSPVTGYLAAKTIGAGYRGVKGLFGGGSTPGATGGTTETGPVDKKTYKTKPFDAAQKIEITNREADISKLKTSAGKLNKKVATDSADFDEVVKRNNKAVSEARKKLEDLKTTKKGNPRKKFTVKQKEKIAALEEKIKTTNQDTGTRKNKLDVLRKNAEAVSKKHSTATQDLKDYKVKARSTKSDVIFKAEVKKLRSQSPAKFAKTLKFGRSTIPYALGGRKGAEIASGLAADLGYEEKGQLVAGLGGGVAGSLTFAKVAKKLTSPKVLRSLTPLIKKFAPKLAAKLLVSGALGASGIGSVLGAAGLAWTAYDLYNLSQSIPEIRRILMEE